MSVQRKRSNINERISLAHERKEQVKEDRRICRMEREADVAVAQKRKRFFEGNLKALASQISFPTLPTQYSV